MPGLPSITIKYDPLRTAPIRALPSQGAPSSVNRRRSSLQACQQLSTAALSSIFANHHWQPLLWTQEICVLNKSRVQALTKNLTGNPHRMTWTVEQNGSRCSRRGVATYRQLLSYVCYR
jgi:hypothetical protein